MINCLSSYTNLKIKRRVSFYTTIGNLYNYIIRIKYELGIMITELSNWARFNHYGYYEW